MAGAPFLWGSLVRKLIKENNSNQIETYLTGVLFLFLLQGAVFFGAVCVGASFMTAVWILAALFLASAAGGLWTLLADARGKRPDRQSWGQSLWQRPDRQAGFWIVLASALFLLQAAVICYYRPTGAGDAMVATVQTTLYTDSMYQYHPMTGQLFGPGMILSRKIVTLPLFYSFICRIFCLPAAQGVYGLGSLLVLVFLYAACARFFGAIFEGRGKNRKIWMGLVFVGLLVLAGGYASGAVGSRVLYFGYQGSHIAVGVLMPYVAAVLYECYNTGGSRGDWIRASGKTAACLAASLFLAPAAEGFFFLLTGLVILALCLAVKEGVRRFLCRK